MAYDFEQLHNDLAYFFKTNRVDRSSLWVGKDAIRYNIFKNTIKDLEDKINDYLKLSDYNCVIEYKPGAGNLAIAPWIGIRKKGTNSNGENSYYMALIYSPDYDALLLNVTTSSTYAKNVLGLKYEQITQLNDEYQKHLEKLAGIKFDNLNNVGALLSNEKSLNEIPNLYLCSSIFYRYIKFDKQNEELIKRTIKELFEVWKATYGLTNPSEYYQSHIGAIASKKITERKASDFIEGKTKEVIDDGKPINLKHASITDPKRNSAKQERKRVVDRKAYKAQRERQEALGDLAEQLVEDFEKENLKRQGRKDLAALVKKLGTDGDGYDVMSYWPDGKERPIEVKSNSSNGKNFYISSNELDKLLDGKTEIYFVKNPASPDFNPRKDIVIVDKTNDMSKFVPVNYLVKVN